MALNEGRGFCINELQQNKRLIGHGLKPCKKCTHCVIIVNYVPAVGTRTVHQPVSFGEEFREPLFNFWRDQPCLGNLMQRRAERLALGLLDKSVALREAHALLGLRKQDKVASGNALQLLKLLQGEADALRNCGQPISLRELMGSLRAYP